MSIISSKLSDEAEITSLSGEVHLLTGGHTIVRLPNDAKAGDLVGIQALSSTARFSLVSEQAPILFLDYEPSLRLETEGAFHSLYLTFYPPTGWIVSSVMGQFSLDPWPIYAPKKGRRKPKGI